MRKEEYIPLAALFHDIGKFAQLGGMTTTENEKKLMTELKLITDSSHFHAILSAAFVKQHFKKGKDEISQLALYHHFPEKAPETIQIDVMRIALADWLSNGSYRGNEKTLAKDVLARPLVSIFSQIFKAENTSQYRYIKPIALNLNLTNLFPKKISELTPEVVTKDFQNLWNDFTNEFEKVDLSSDFEKYYSTILALLEKYTITIPAVSEAQEQYITLYHHLKSTAAIATCLTYLADEEIEQAYAAIKENKLADEKLSETSFYLVGGDISGIQDFIYSVTSERALKGLRGRSFYLQLISEAVARSIVDRFGLPSANILYIGGGHFFLLLPKKANIADELNEIIEIVDHNLLEAHHGKLALVIADKTLSYHDLLGSGFGGAFHSLKKELSIAKRRKFASLIQTKTELEKIMNLPDIGGTQEVCEICSDELTDREQKIAKQKQTHQCRFCESYISLANNLAYNDLLIERKLPGSFKKFEGEFGSYEEVLKYLGYHFEFSKEKNEGETNLLINSSEFLSNSKSCNGFRFFPKYAPFIFDKKEKKDRVKTLEDFSDEATGLKTWGVFRADVDHLGTIFKEGLGENQTIATISMLSYFVSLFFSAHVEHVAHKDSKENIYIIYSGGDDMFALGSWSALPDFAIKIQDNFIKFTGDNPAIKISGGIYISPSKKFPVYQAADSAGDSLELSKHKGRNRITIFDTHMLWTDFGNVMKLAEQIAALLKEKDGKKKVPQSLLQILYSAWAEKERVEKEREDEQKDKGFSIFRIWRILYAFKRFRERNRKHEQELNELEMKIVTNHELKPYLDVATRWAEYLTR